MIFGAFSIKIKNEMLLLAILTSIVLRKKENSLFTYTLFRGWRRCWSSPSGVQSVVQGCYIP